jgi:Fur family transcriptional regulator, peroxide stress response regulator
MESLPLNHQELRKIIEQAGLRCTPQRLAVYDHLSQSTEHPTAEDVFQAVRSRIPKISLATVYKALEAWVAVGLATKFTVGTGGNCARYDARRDLHYHFRCLRSGAVHDLPTRFDPDLITKLDPRLHEDLSRQGFQVTGYRLELVGYQTSSSAGMEHAPDLGAWSQSVPAPAPTAARPLATEVAKS